MLRDRIVAALEAAPYPLRVGELVEAVYAGDPSGGPLSARGIIAVVVCKMRRDGDHRVITLGHRLYALAGREYGPRPSDPRIVVIRRMRRAGRSCREIAEQFGIHPSYASVLSRRAA